VSNLNHSSVFHLTYYYFLFSEHLRYLMFGIDEYDSMKSDRETLQFCTYLDLNM